MKDNERKMEKYNRIFFEEQVGEIRLFFGYDEVDNELHGTVCTEGSLQYGFPNCLILDVSCSVTEPNAY